jgi:hypothetical protein
MIPTKRNDEYSFEEEALNRTLQGFFYIQHLSQSERVYKVYKVYGNHGREEYENEERRKSIITLQAPFRLKIFKGAALCLILPRDQGTSRRPSPLA